MNNPAAVRYKRFMGCLRVCSKNGPEKGYWLSLDSARITSAYLYGSYAIERYIGEGEWEVVHSGYH